MAFLKDITLGQYFPGDSPVHRLDPRTKFLTCLMVMLCLFLIESWIFQIFLIAVFLFTIRFSKIPYQLVLNNVRPFLWLFLLTFILHLFLAKGRVIWQVPYFNFPIYSEALQNGIIYSFRLVLLILVAALLTLTTSPVALTDALNKLMSPLRRFGLPVYDLIMMITLAMRFIPTLLQEAERIQMAQMSRGISYEGRLWQKLKNILPLLLPLFISAFRRADELAMAMDSRCYHGGEGRTSFVQLKFSTLDYGVLVSSGGLLIFSILFKLQTKFLIIN